MEKRGQRKHFRAKESIYYIFWVMVIGVCLVWVVNHTRTQSFIRSASANLEMMQAAAEPVQELNQELGEVEKELEAYKAKYPDPKREEIEAYVRLIFRKDNPDVALAISHHECGYTNKNYPKCSLKSTVENSIGLFQINLHNAHKNIHADRIPGVTMEEKILWLENPFNNTLYAYWVYKTSGWNPWSAYTNGAYLNDPLMN